MEKINVLFLCTGNSARSQMAEAFLRSYGEGNFEAFSAGVERSIINPYTRRVMEEIGFNLEGQYSKSMNEYLSTDHFDYVVTVCDDAVKNCLVFPGDGKRLHWSFDDPAVFLGTEELRLSKFREIRDLIKEKVLSWVMEHGGTTSTS